MIEADTHADADADAEPPIPPFAAYTDAEQARRLLQGCSAELFGRAVTLTSCVVIDSRYKTYAKASSWPRSTMAVCYRLGLADAEDSAIVYAKVFLGGRSRAEWQRLGSAPAAVPPAVIHLPSLDMIAWRFPHDPSLPHLAEVLRPEHLRRHLPYDALPAGLDGPADLLHLSAEPLKYDPENCCTARLRLQWRGAAASLPPQELIVFAKTYGDDRGRSAYQRMQHYWRSRALPSCRPLGYDETIRTVWSLGVEGRPLAKVIDRSNQQRYLGRLGRGLAVVHASNPADLGVLEGVALPTLLAECLKKIDKLGRACAPCAEALTLLVVPALPWSAPPADGAHAGRALHGDFHIDQVLADDGEVYLLDFDSFALGDPEQDLAEFIVALLFHGFAPALARTMALSLVQSYCAAARWTLRPERLDWYARVEYVTRVYRFYRQQRPGWQTAMRQSVSNLPALHAVLTALAR